MKNLPLSASFLGKHRIELDATPSTNTYAAELLDKQRDGKTNSLPEGTLITARHQPAGRGQRGSGWESEPGKNLTLSFILYPRFLTPAKMFLLNQAVSLGVYDLAKAILGEGVTIKWPNDIYYCTRKLAGILIENQMDSSCIHTSVAGIGINVNQTVFSPDLPNPVSFRQLTGKEYDLNECTGRLCDTLEERYLQLRSGREDVLKQDYLNALFGYRVSGDFMAGTTHIRGTITGVSEEGKLLLASEDGTVKGYQNKEIQFVIPTS